MANKLASENAAQLGAIDGQLTGTLVGGDGRPLRRDDNRPPSVVEMLTSDLSETYALEFAKVDPIRERANAREQKIASDEDLAEWTKIYLDAKQLWKSLDDARKAEARPLDQAIKNVFDPRLAPLAKIVEWIKTKADTYNRDKLMAQRAKEAAERERLRKIEEEQRREAEIAAEFGRTEDTLEQVAKIYETREQINQVQEEKTADVARVRAEGGGLATAASVWKYEVADYAKVDLNALRLIIDRKAIDTAIAKVVKNQKGATKIEGVRVYEDVGTTFRA